jgi:EmrB/QacA subfamily drug resistance transporter
VSGNSTTENDTGSSGAVKLSRSQLIATIIGLQLSLLVAAIDQTIVAAAMPIMVDDLGGFDRYAWVTSAYLLTSTTAVPIFGKLSDLYGRKWLLLSGVVLFVIASLFCGWAGKFDLFNVDGMTQLIAARAVQGLGGGIILSLVFASLGDIFAPAERGKYQGLFAAVWAIAGLAGPALGGWISETFSWRWVFYINLPVGIIASLALIFAFPHLQTGKRQPKIDVPGIVCLVGFVVPLLMALNTVTQATQLGQALVLFTTAFAFLAALLALERRAPEPVIPLDILQHPIVSIALISVFITGIGMFGSTMLLPIFFQSVLGLNATTSGSLLTPLMVTVAVGSTISGALLTKLGKYKMLALIGCTLMAVGTVLIGALTPTHNLPVIMGSMVVSGIGLGLILPVYTIVIQNTLSQALLGTATGLTQFFRTLGGALGSAVFGLTILYLYNVKLGETLPKALPESVRAAVSDPLNPGKLKALIEQHLGNAPKASNVLQIVQSALEQSIATVFVIYGTLLISIVILNLFLKEIPLRKANEPQVTSD